MKKFIISLLVFIPVLSFAQSHIKVKGIELDGSFTEVYNKFKAAGLTPDPDKAELLGRPVLAGDFAGLKDCSFVFITDEKQSYVAKLIIFSDSESSWSAIKSKYSSLKKSYKDKYENLREYEFFKNPYEEGDGYELLALDEEKCTYRFFVFIDEGAISVSIDSASYDQAYLTISYEDKINFEKFTNERLANISDEI